MGHVADPSVAGITRRSDRAGERRRPECRPGSSRARRADQNEQLDDDADRTIAETRQYLDDADELLRTENTAVDFFNAKVERYPTISGGRWPAGRRRSDAPAACVLFLLGAPSGRPTPLHANHRV
jgi:hypothetical protein